MEPERLRAVIAANIRRHAARKGLTMPVLAGLAGVAHGGLYRVVNGTAYIRADTLARVAAALGVLPRQLVDERAVEGGKARRSSRG